MPRVVVLLPLQCHDSQSGPGEGTGLELPSPRPEHVIQPEAYMTLTSCGWRRGQAANHTRPDCDMITLCSQVLGDPVAGIPSPIATAGLVCTAVQLQQAEPVGFHTSSGVLQRSGSRTPS